MVRRRSPRRFSSEVRDQDLRLNDAYTLSPDGKQLTFRQRHQFGSEPEGDGESVFLRQPDSAWPADEQVYKNIQVLKGVLSSTKTTRKPSSLLAK